MIMMGCSMLQTASSLALVTVLTNDPSPWIGVNFATALVTPTMQKHQCIPAVVDEDSPSLCSFASSRRQAFHSIISTATSVGVSAALWQPPARAVSFDLEEGLKPATERARQIQLPAGYSGQDPNALEGAFVVTYHI